jgi:tetratricopeptide (TPR) repeat protein
MEKIGKPTEIGDYETAIATIEKEKKKLYNSEDAFLFEFDLGILHHYNQNYKESTNHFAAAEQILEDLYTRSITNEAAAILTNDNVRPYRSYPFEIQWLHQTQILNYLALGEIDGAVVQARRALLALQSLKEKEEDKLNESGALQYLIALSFEWQKSEDDARIAYDNAKRNFASSGHTPRLAAEVPQNEQEIIVVGYAGASPILGANEFWGTYARDGVLFLRYKDANGKEQTITLVALGLGGPGFSGQTTTIQFEIPKMVERASQTGTFSIAVNGNPIATEIFSNTKSSLKKDLENGERAMLLRTAGRVILRTIAASKAKDKMRTGNGLADLALNLGTDFATGAMEKADLRLGSTMPLTLQIARIPVEPGKHSVKIDILDGYGRKIGHFAEESVNVKKDGKIFIFAPALR